MANDPKKPTIDGDPLMRAASQGFVNAPAPEPTIETLQRAMHPRDYDQWKAAEDAKLKRANDIKNATMEATAKADEEDEKLRAAADQKALAAAKDREGYRTRSVASAGGPTPNKPAA